LSAVQIEASGGWRVWLILLGSVVLFLFMIVFIKFT
jgi:hypothetical protein